MVSDTGEPLDELGDTRQCPDIGAEPLRAWARSQRALDRRELRGIQLGFPPRASCPSQPGPALCLPRMEPVVGTDPRDSQRYRYRYLRFATREQPRGFQPTRLHRGQIPCGCRHASACDPTSEIS
jgi:hypothetical protein